MSRPIRVWKIVSGGQTGVDRGGLLAAIHLGLEHGGWCPSGRRAEDGVIPAMFALSCTASPHYSPRTRNNVRDSDGTLILCRGTPRGGTALTCRVAQKLGRPVLVVDLDQPADYGAVRDWLVTQRIGVLNVAGPRASDQPTGEEDARLFLIGLLSSASRDDSEPSDFR